MILESVVDQRFAIDELAGSGGMGVVHRARDLATGEVVALKVLRESQLHEAELRFEREAQVLAELHHPGVVRFVAHGHTRDQLPYLVMEWIEGEDLSVRLRRGALSVDEALTLGARVAEALGAAHERGVVHRDLKPSNILLVGGAIDAPKIVDFGIATFPEAVRATMSGTVVGTPAYMAPEQARATRDLDARADVFALGCILHECLAGRPTFAGQQVMAVLAKIVFDDVPRLRDLGCAVPSALDMLIARLLSKDPAERPADGVVLARLLRGIETALEGGAGGVPSGGGEGASLTHAEQRIVCVVLAKPLPGLRVDPAAETLVATDQGSSWATAKAITAAESHGGRAEVLADGTMAVTTPSTGLATDQAAVAASSALSIRAAVPDWMISVATGRADAAAARPTGEAIERAAERIGQRRRMPETRAIDVDDVTAGLLDLRFDVAAGPLGLELRGERDLAEHARTLLGRPTAFVGRDREMSTLRALFDECAEEPAARAALVTGPAGIGKSRLRHELMESLRARGGVELWIARGDPMRAGAAFGLLAPLLRHAARLRDGDPIDERRQNLLARVSRHVPARHRQRVAEFLGELVGTTFPDDDRVQLRAARQDPLLLGDQMKRAFLDLVDAETRAGPLVIVLEDLQWGDAPSEEYTDAALRVFRDRPLFVIGFARPEIHERAPGLWRPRAVQEIRLPELPRRACERLARDVLGERVTADDCARLWERSGGNAFFLEELLRATAAGHAGALPETMLAMVESRLEALHPEDRRLLRAGSVFGDVFWRGGLAALLGEDDRVDERLARLEAQEWLVRRHDEKFRGEAEYVFRHGMMREGAYGMLTAEDRALGHRLAGAWLESVGEADAVALAEHYERGGESESAVHWYVVAAEQALEANDLRTVGLRTERAVALGATGEILGRAALANAHAKHWLGNHTEAGVWGERAAELFEEGTTPWEAALGCAIWSAGIRGDVDAVLALTRRLLASLERTGPSATAVIEVTHATTWMLLGARFDEAALAMKTLESYADLRASPAVDAAWLAASSTFAAVRGDPFALRADLASAIARFEAAGDMRKASLYRCNLADACTRLGEHEHAVELVRAAIANAEALGLSFVLPVARQNEGAALSRSGHHVEAISMLRETIETCRGNGDLHAECGTRLYLAGALLRGGDPASSEAEARRALDRVSVFPGFEPLAAATLADALLLQGRAGEALDHAQRAFDRMRSLGKVEEGDVMVRAVYAEALYANGRVEEARAIIAEARDRLLALAARADDEARSRSFLEAVPENARVLALAGRWLDAGG